MSDTEENVLDSPASGEAAGEVISIPGPTDEAEESDISPEQEYEIEEFTTESEETVEHYSDLSVSTPKSYDSKPRDEVVSLGSATDSHEQEYRLGDLGGDQRSEEDEMSFLYKIKAIKENLQSSVKECIATVKIVLIPAGQEIVMPFRVDAPFRFLKEHFAHLLRIPHHVLQMAYTGASGRSLHIMVTIANSMHYMLENY